MKAKSTYFSRIWNKYNYVLIFFVILIVLLGINGSATTWVSLMNIPRHSTVIGIIALAMGLIILTGDIDLSVGSQLAFIGGSIVMVFNNTNSIFLSLLFGVAFGGLLGLFNGFLIGRLKMPAFIVTLATMLMFRSIAQTIMNSNKWTIYQLNAKLSQWQTLWKIGNASMPAIRIPYMVIIFLIVVILMTYVTTNTKFGKRVYAIGSNEKAAHLSGINVWQTRIVVYAIGGILIGFATFLYVANVGSVDPATSGKNYELYAIAGVVIGEISMSGGKGRLSGVLFGAMSFTIIDKIITALGLNPLINDTIKGGILLLAIGVQMLPEAFLGMRKNQPHRLQKNRNGKIRYPAIPRKKLIFLLSLSHKNGAPIAKSEHPCYNTAKSDWLIEE